MTTLPFQSLALSDEILKAVEEMGFTEASPIQSEAIPFLLEGKDVIGQAQTGTGKTAAFSIPILENLDPDEKKIQALVLCPTRELALQVSNEIKKLSKYKRQVHSLAVYGGEPIDKQIKALKRGISIVVGTPGRIIDHINRRTLDLKSVKTIVLDEADEMLDMGFRDDIESIMEQLPESRQTVFFSATMPKPILALTQKYQKNPQLIKVVKNELTVASIEQYYYEIKSGLKVEVMTRLISQNDLKLMLVFCNTKRKVDEVVEELQLKGFSAEGLHGDMNQNQRNRVMAKFRSGAVTILVATDVAARGIDVSDVDAVFNYDFPLDPEYYVHRIGRTGRAGKSGKSFSFIWGKEKFRLKDVERYTKVQIQRQPVPSGKELKNIKREQFLEKVRETLNDGGLDTYADMTQTLLAEGLEESQIIAALIKIHIGKQEEALENLNQFSERDYDSDRPERGDRGDRGERGGFRKRRGDENTVRIFINLGKTSKIRPGDIVGAIAGETGVPGNSIGEIEIFDKFSFVNVPKDEADKIVRIMSQSQIKGKKVNMEIAKPGAGGSGSGGYGGNGSRDSGGKRRRRS